MNSSPAKVYFLKIIALLFSSLFFSDCNAQFLDTLNASFHTKPKFFFQVDAYNSFVSNKGANTFGYKAGLEFNNRIKMGIGYYKLISNIVRPDSVGQHNNTLPTKQLEMYYVPVLFEYIFYNEDPWQVSIPINIGLGKSYFWYYKNTALERGQLDKKTVAVMTVNLDGQYKILKWFGVGAGLGFRVMLKDNNNINETFNSVIYSLRLRLFVDEIYRSLFKKEK